METKKEKKLVSFFTDKNDVIQYNNLLFSRSKFFRNCINKAIYNKDFYYNIMKDFKINNIVNKKQCVTFYVDKKDMKYFDELYSEKSLFLRKCLKKAITDFDFFYGIIKENSTIEEIRYLDTQSSYKENKDGRCIYEN